MAGDHEIYHIPTVTMATPDNSSCPPDSHMDAVRSELSNQLSDVMASKVGCIGSGWRQVAFLNMRDPNQTCPLAWRLYNSFRVCGRWASDVASCDPVRFSSSGYAYTQVCGRITGYQFGSPNGGRHKNYSPDEELPINEPYLDGVSITCGRPRKHIWTFFGEMNSVTCCSDKHINNTESLGFIGGKSFCDTGNLGTEVPQKEVLTEHPLWDGITYCPSSDTCCTPHSGPWFHTTLPLPTMADIEIRICGDQKTANEDTPLELVEIYVK